MNEQLWLGGEAVVDDVIQHRDVDSPSRQICHQEDASSLVTELGDVDLTGRLIERTVAAGTRDPGGLEHLATDAEGQWGHRSGFFNLILGFSFLDFKKV